MTIFSKSNTEKDSIVFWWIHSTQIRCVDIIWNRYRDHLLKKVYASGIHTLQYNVGINDAHWLHTALPTWALVICLTIVTSTLLLVLGSLPFTLVCPHFVISLLLGLVNVHCQPFYAKLSIDVRNAHPLPAHSIGLPLSRI